MKENNALLANRGFNCQKSVRFLTCSGGSSRVHSIRVPTRDHVSGSPETGGISEPDDLERQRTPTVRVVVRAAEMEANSGIRLVVHTTSQRRVPSCCGEGLIHSHLRQRAHSEVLPQLFEDTDPAAQEEAKYSPAAGGEAG